MARCPKDFVDPPSFLLSLATLGGESLKGQVAKLMDDWLTKGNWTVVAHDESSVTFERSLPSLNLKLIKRYTLEPVPPGSRQDENYPGYNLQLDVEVQNTGDVEQSVAYRLDGPRACRSKAGGTPTRSASAGSVPAGLRDVVVRFAGLPEQQIDCGTIAKGKDEPMGQGASLAYVGVDAVYFSAVMIPVKESLEEGLVRFHRGDPHRSRAVP